MRKRVLIGLLIGGAELRNLIESQSAAIGLILEEREEEKTRTEMEYLRYVRDLMKHFLRILDSTDDDFLRYELKKGLSDLEDHVARLEEHAA